MQGVLGRDAEYIPSPSCSAPFSSRSSASCEGRGSQARMPLVPLQWHLLSTECSATSHDTRQGHFALFGTNEPMELLRGALSS